MSEQIVTPLKAGMRYGVILGIVIIIISIVERALGWDPFSGSDSKQLIADITGVVVTFGVILWAVRYYRNSNEGFLTFGEGISTSLFVGIFSGLISAIFTFILLSYIVPEADVRDTLEIEDDFSISPFSFAMMTFVAHLFLSLFLGLISAVILRKGN